jgi:hypothetical protein
MAARLMCGTKLQEQGVSLREWGASSLVWGTSAGVSLLCDELDGENATLIVRG